MSENALAKGVAALSKLPPWARTLLAVTGVLLVGLATMWWFTPSKRHSPPTLRDLDADVEVQLSLPPATRPGGTDFPTVVFTVPSTGVHSTLFTYDDGGPKCLVTTAAHNTLLVDTLLPAAERSAADARLFKRLATTPKFVSSNGDILQVTLFLSAFGLLVADSDLPTLMRKQYVNYPWLATSRRLAGGPAVLWSSFRGVETGAPLLAEWPFATAALIAAPVGSPPLPANVLLASDVAQATLYTYKRPNQTVELRFQASGDVLLWDTAAAGDDTASIFQCSTDVRDDNSLTGCVAPAITPTFTHRYTTGSLAAFTTLVLSDTDHEWQLITGNSSAAATRFASSRTLTGGESSDGASIVAANTAEVRNSSVPSAVTALVTATDSQPWGLSVNFATGVLTITHGTLVATTPVWASDSGTLKCCTSGFTPDAQQQIDWPSQIEGTPSVLWTVGGSAYHVHSKLQLMSNGELVYDFDDTVGWIASQGSSLTCVAPGDAGDGLCAVGGGGDTGDGGNIGDGGDGGSTGDGGPTGDGGSTGDAPSYPAIYRQYPNQYGGYAELEVAGDGSLNIWITDSGNQQARVLAFTSGGTLTVDPHALSNAQSANVSSMLAYITANPTADDWSSDMPLAWTAAEGDVVQQEGNFVWSLNRAIGSLSFQQYTDTWFAQPLWQSDIPGPNRCCNGVFGVQSGSTNSSVRAPQVYPWPATSNPSTALFMMDDSNDDSNDVADDDDGSSPLSLSLTAQGDVLVVRDGVTTYQASTMVTSFACSMYTSNTTQPSFCNLTVPTPVSSPTSTIPFASPNGRLIGRLQLDSSGLFQIRFNDSQLDPTVENMVTLWQSVQPYMPTLARPGVYAGLVDTVNANWLSAASDADVGSQALLQLGKTATLPLAGGGTTPAALWLDTLRARLFVSSVTLASDWTKALYASRATELWSTDQGHASCPPGAAITVHQYPASSNTTYQDGSSDAVLLLTLAQWGAGLVWTPGGDLVVKYAGYTPFSVSADTRTQADCNGPYVCPWCVSDI